MFSYDRDNLIEETTGTGVVVTRYLQGLNIDEPLSMLRSGATSYYNLDGLGSVSSLSNAGGSLAQTYTFDSFGKQTASSGALTNPFQYTAREFDAETSLYNYRARYYDPSTGRFVSEDPVRFKGGINFYAYVSNNPIAFADPKGLWGRDGDGVGPEGCKYYDNQCKSSCPRDSYACTAGDCCRSFGDNPKANCARKCLMDVDQSCKGMSGADRAKCRTDAHIYCYLACKFFPNVAKLPTSCWLISDGYGYAY